ncbi:MAG: hypothetical protein JRJ72_13110 [Deltaproteobacteria bacterium]|nr:hypothetical protein [Deltaproteobacteria bacterium]
MSLATDIADAVVAELNAAPAGTFSQPFTAQRRVLPEFDLEDLAQLKVSVVPKSVEITGSTRAASQYEIAVDVGVQKKLGKDLDAEVAALGTLVDEMADFLRGRTLDQAPFAVWVGIRNDPVYAPEHLAERRVFTSVLTVTYRAMK